MAFYAAPFTFDFEQNIVDVDLDIDDVDCRLLYSVIKIAQASEEGIAYEPIGSGSGLNTLGPGVQVGLTVELLGAWQLRFPEGNYVARVAGGNLIGGPGGDPIAYSAGVQTLLIQSAASTVVTEGGSISDDVRAALTAQGYTTARAGRIDNLDAPVSEAGLTNTQATQLAELHTMRGLDPANPMTVTPEGESAGGINLTFTGDGEEITTVTRQ